MAEAPSPGEMTIDELAASAGVPTRTIRFYQARGALQKPEIRGRVAYYGPAHAERLKLIAQLQDRGLRINAIRDLVSGIDSGELDLAQWLGVEREASAPWADDAPRTVDEAELYQLAGTKRPGLIADLVRSKLVTRHGETFVVHSPGMLQLASKLEAAGIEPDMAQQASEILQKQLHRAVKDLVELFVKAVRDGSLELSEPESMFATLRPVGIDAVKLIFAREMDRELRKLVESGGLATLPRRRRRRR